MKSEYVTLLTVTISLLSGWGGAFIGGYFSRKASTDTLNKEYEIEKTKKRQKEKTKLLNLYVTLIKLNYEENPIEYRLHGEMWFDNKFFTSEIRPKIYEKYYLIHKSVILHFNRIEDKNEAIENSDLFGGFDESDVSDIAYSYEKMIEEIKIIVDKQRINID